MIEPVACRFPTVLAGLLAGFLLLPSPLIAGQDEGHQTLPPKAPAPARDLSRGGTGTVSGTVETVDGDPLAFLTDVLAFEEFGGGFFVRTTTDADGNYTLTLGPGNYTIVTDVGPFPDFNAFDHVYPDNPCLGGPFSVTCDPQGGDLIEVLPGEDITGIDFSLPIGGRVVGNAAERSTGFHATFARIRYLDTSGNLVAESTTGIRNTRDEVLYGPYAVPPGDYLIQVGMRGFEEQLFPGIPCPDFACDPLLGTPVSLAAGDDVRIDFALEIETGKGGIAGVLFLGDVSSERVEVFDNLGFSDGSAIAFVPFGVPSGGYVIGGLDPGTYYARLGDGGTRLERYRDMPCPDTNCDPVDGTPITVVADQITGGIDFQTDLETDLVVTNVPAMPDPGDRFGAATAADGNLVAVGQPDAAGGGQVVIFRVEGDELVEEQTIPVPDGRLADDWGASIAVDGGRLLIGAPGSAAIRAKGDASALQAALFERTNQSWSMKQEFASAPGAGNDAFAAAVSLDGDTVAIGAPEADGQGAVYVFGLTGFNVTEQVTLQPPNPTAGGQFGASVAAKGGLVGVGSPGSAIGNVVSGSATLYGQVAGNLGSLAPQGTVNGSGSDEGGAFGTSVALSGTTLAVGAPAEDGSAAGSGAVYAFGFTGSTVTEQARILSGAPDAGAAFGAAVALRANGLAVGAPGAAGGQGRVFSFDEDYALLGILAPPNEGIREFGAAVSASGPVIVAGAPGTAESAGAALAEIDFEQVFSGSFE